MGRFSLLDADYSPSQNLWGMVIELDSLRKKLSQLVEVDKELACNREYFMAMISIGDAADHIRNLRSRASRDKVSEFQIYQEDLVL